MIIRKGRNRRAGRLSALALYATVSISGASAAELALNWDKVTDPTVTQYQVSWGTSSGAYLDSMDVTTPPAQVTGLAAGQKYYFAVRACTTGKSNCSVYSSEISTTTSAPPPPPEPPAVALSASSYSGTAPLTVVFSSNLADTPSVPKALANYTFDNRTGVDQSGSGNNSTLLGGPVFATDTPDGSAYSLRFDGVNDTVSAGKFDISGTGLTLSAWFKADDFTASDPRLISKATGSAANDHLWMLGLTTSGSDQRLRARVRVGGTTTTLVASSGNLVKNTWYHAALTHDGTTVRLYLNGAQVGSTSLTGAVDVDPAVSVAIGSNPGAGYGLFRGLIDDVHILTRALDGSAVAALAGGNKSVVNPTSTTYLWTFGDGSSSSAKSPSHTYTSKGNYSVSLVTNGPDGSKQYQLDRQIAVAATSTGGPVDPPAPETPAPVASFSANVKSGAGPLTVTFSNSSTNATSYLWDFGDGQKSTTKAPIHVYTAAGSYSVRLTATGEGGSAVNYQGQYITVTSSGINAEFQADVTRGPAPLSVRFTATPSGTVSSYNWNFGDGASSSQANPTHSYQKPGNYTVSLTVSGPDGSNTRTKTGLITAEEKPENNPLQIEVGETQVDHRWMTVALSKRFINPVVVVNPLSLNGNQPAVVQVKNVTENSFAVRLHEWSYLDGIHWAETVGYVVVEAGSHQLPDGNRIEAGTLELDAPRSAYRVGFKQSFAGNPVVLSTIASDNDPSGTAVTTRMKGVDSYGFDILLQKEEALPKTHAKETINYLAWQSSKGEVDGYTYEVGSTKAEVKHTLYNLNFTTPFKAAPVLLADMQTVNGPDTANIRWTTKTKSNVTIMVQEEASLDAETAHHNGEVVGYLAIERKLATANAVDASVVTSYAFDEGAGSSKALDTSGRGFDGVLVGSPTYQADTGDGSAYALRFDGIDDSVYAGLIDVSGSALTLAARFKADSFPGDYQDPRLISKATSSADSDHIFMLSTIKVDNKTRLRARVRTNGITTELVANSGDLGVGQWHHAAATYDGATIRLYLDGIQVGSTPASGTVDTDPGVAVSIGGLPEINSRYFHGLIDDVRILERAMSGSELGALAAGG